MAIILEGGAGAGAAATTVSMITLLREFAERIYADKADTITGTASGGDTTSLIDDGSNVSPGLKYSSADASALNRWFVYREASSETSRVTVGGLSGSDGDLTISPAITAFADTNKYILCQDRPQRLKNILNRVIRNLYVPTLFPLSMFIVTGNDNDMENDPDTNYSSTDATLANESTVVLSGAQSLKITSTDTDGHAYTASFSVNEGESLYAAVLCSVTQGDDAEFRIVNKQDSDAAIENATTDEPAAMELVFQFSVPSGCEQIAAWMISVGSDDVTYWDNLQIWSGGRHLYNLPSWFVEKSQMIDVRGFPHGSGGPGSDNDYRANEQGSRALDWEWEDEDRLGVQELRIEVQGTGTRPFIYAYRQLTELSTDAATTVADKDWVLDWAERIYNEPEREAEFLGLIRVVVLSRPVAKSPITYGVRIG